MKRFILQKKLVACVRYYETMYFITDGEGTRVFTGNDEKIAKQILKTLNGYQITKDARKRKIRKLKVKRK